MPAKARLLIVEDERAVSQGLIDLFVYHGYEVDHSADGREGLEKALRGKYDLVLLDVMLPSLDGYSVCNEIRAVNRTLPIIMLTARTSDEDIITGLSLGADDYVGKPFSVRQLVLRVESVLRRTRPHGEELAHLSLGDRLVIDCANLTGTSPDGKGGPRETVFTRREVDILQYLRAHADRPVSRGELLLEVWGYSKAARIETRTVDIHIAKLRRKIEQDPANPRYLVTVRGEVYKLLESQ